MGRVDWNTKGEPKAYAKGVSPCMGRVDWNVRKWLQIIQLIIVSPCMGRVDWNIIILCRFSAIPSRLSLYGESGLKYRFQNSSTVSHLLSLPVWGEWIEIVTFNVCTSRLSVSPCMGRVDWNLLKPSIFRILLNVSPCMERVDWNYPVRRRPRIVAGLSLYGESGLK